ncbi:MAG TPA: MoaD/ThiS family protein [Methanothrix sp.]|nr:MoaD/ThiS family protein [Methanothrix sp.]HOK59070.1 MoaD/ThiS family protein [Methanothrix sp.]HOL44347.1 MoaD/ThiS family protein [Methanothrix sp.]HPO89308.1 MoaD/ThiS family protein [Methanothrix sp.]
MRIRLRSFGTLRRDLGGDLILEMDEGSLLRDALLSLRRHERLVDGLRIKDDVYVLVNGRSVSDINTALRDGDEIAIVPAIIGG